MIMNLNHKYIRMSNIFTWPGMALICSLGGIPKSSAFSLLCSIYIETCQGHPVLVKKAWSTCGWTKGSLAPCLVAARAVRWRPRLAGTRQYNRSCLCVCLLGLFHFVTRYYLHMDIIDSLSIPTRDGQV